MSTGFKSQVVPSYRLLTEDQIQELSTRHALTTAGYGRACVSPTTKQLAMLQQGRLPGDRRPQVTFPAGLVEDAIKSAPSSHHHL